MPPHPDFSPFNPIVRQCILAMQQEENGHPNEALILFQQAWNDATNDFEKFLVAHHIARLQHSGADRLHWLETALRLALQIQGPAVMPALPALYTRIAKCHEEQNEVVLAKQFHDRATACSIVPDDPGPFFHGTRANLQPGDFLRPGNPSNYQQDLTMNHIYFTAMIQGAGLAASLAKGEGKERVYVVEPCGSFEHDPNVTDKRFPGNPTRSYRSAFPLRILGEIQDWQKHPEEELQRWRERLKHSKGDIIN